MIRAVFLDRDGTIVEEFSDGTVDTKGIIFPSVYEGLMMLQNVGFSLFFITNQRPIAVGILTEESFWQTNAKIINKLNKRGIKIESTQMCPHQDSDGCKCRKPKTGMIDDLRKQYDIDIQHSWFIGDRSTDIELGTKLGCRTIQVHYGEPRYDQNNEADFATTDLTKAAEYVISKI
jgi:D-glycero-D-manno-heptose 1,7-bisphosphate phosphatase